MQVIQGDLLSGNLLEPEIILDQSLIVKKENAENDVQDIDIDEEDNILLIEMQRRVDTPPINDADSSFEDPLHKSSNVPIKNTTKIKSKKCFKKESISSSSVLETHQEDSSSENLNPSSSNNEEKTLSKVDNTSMGSKSCRKSYYQPKTNRRELDKFLSEHIKLTCNICQKSMDTFRQLLKHSSEEHKERGYVICCESKHYDRISLVDHINYHLNPESFKCEQCSKVLKNRGGLLAHIQKCHEEKRFACDICSKKFPEKYKLEEHKLRHLPEEEKKFPCSDCGK